MPEETELTIRIDDPLADDPLSADAESEHLRGLQAVLDTFGYISMGCSRPHVRGEVISQCFLLRLAGGLRSRVDLKFVVIGESNAKELEAQCLLEPDHGDVPVCGYYYRVLAE